jgi:hypothetical protein
VQGAAQNRRVVFVIIGGGNAETTTEPGAGP